MSLLFQVKKYIIKKFNTSSGIGLITKALTPTFVYIYLDPSIISLYLGFSQRVWASNPNVRTMAFLVCIVRVGVLLLLTLLFFFNHFVKELTRALSPPYTKSYISRMSIYKYANKGCFSLSNPHMLWLNIELSHTVVKGHLLARQLVSQNSWFKPNPIV